MLSLEAELVDKPTQALVPANVSLRTLNFISNERVVFMLLLSTIWTLILTVVPVVTTLPPTTYYLPHKGWYSGDDVMRFVEPVGGLLLNCIIFYQAPIFHFTHPKSSTGTDGSGDGGLLALPDHWLLFSIFAISLAVYQQGAGFHSASNMLKNALHTIIDTEGDDTFFNNELHDLYFYMRTVWEHDVSHYLYAVGLVGVQMCQLHAHWERKGSDVNLIAHLIASSPPSGAPQTTFDHNNHNNTVNNATEMLVQPSRFASICLFFSALSYGILIAAVAINYPAGLIVGLVYVLVLFAVIVVSLLIEWKNETDVRAFRFGYRPVVHHFGLGCLWAVFFIVIWIIINGGIVQRSNSAVVST